MPFAGFNLPSHTAGGHFTCISEHSWGLGEATAAAIIPGHPMLKARCTLKRAIGVGLGGQGGLATTKPDGGR